MFEREWLVNLILFGNYGRLREAALDALGETVTGQTLQLACVYGNLTPRLARRLAPGASLDVVDILPVQLKNLAAKLPADERIVLLQGDSSALACPDASYDQVLLFFLLHEQPEAVRRATLAEAMRVVRPGGRIVIVDYHLPVRWHPLRLLMTGVFRKLEPYAMDLWENEVQAFLPAHLTAGVHHQTNLLRRAVPETGPGPLRPIWKHSRQMSRSSAPAAPACERRSPSPRPTPPSASR